MTELQLLKLVRLEASLQVISCEIQEIANEITDQKASLKLSLFCEESFKLMDKIGKFTTNEQFKKL